MGHISESPRIESHQLPPDVQSQADRSLRTSRDARFVQDWPDFSPEYKIENFGSPERSPLEIKTIHSLPFSLVLGIL